jgi:hypothetical protein
MPRDADRPSYADFTREQLLDVVDNLVRQRDEDLWPRCLAAEAEVQRLLERLTCARADGWDAAHRACCEESDSCRLHVNPHTTAREPQRTQGEPT